MKERLFPEETTSLKLVYLNRLPIVNPFLCRIVDMQGRSSTELLLDILYNLHLGIFIDLQ